MTVAMPGVRRPFLPTEAERRIAAALRETRAKRRLTQTEVAKRIGVTSRTLLRYEKLERSIPTGHLLALQELLGPLGQPTTGAMYDRALGATVDAVTNALGPRAMEPFVSPFGEPGASQDEERLLRIFRGLRPEKQYMLLGFALTLQELPK